MTATATDDLSARIFGTEVDPDDSAKFNYASIIKHLRSIESALPPAEFDKIRTQMVRVVNLTYSSTLGQLRGRDDIWYSDGTPVVRLVRDGEFQEIPGEWELLGEQVGEYDPPPGWEFEVAPPPVDNTPLINLAKRIAKKQRRQRGL